MKYLILTFFILFSANVLFAQCTAPSITSQTAINDTVCTGTSTSLSVTTAGTGPITYQWRLGTTNISNGAVYSGANTSSLTISNATSAMNGNQYTCVVTGACSPNATCNTITLTVLAAPATPTDTSNSPLCVGQILHLHATCSTPGIQYQWTGPGCAAPFNSISYSGDTSIVAAATCDSGDYLVICSLITGSVTCFSENATHISINPLPAPPSTNIDYPNHSITVCQDSPLFIQGFTGGLYPLGVPSYSWYPTPFCYGGGGPAYVQNIVVANAQLCDSGMYVFNDFYTYFRQGVNLSCYSANPDTVYVHINSSPAITSQPLNTTVCSGSNASFTVTVSGSGLTYQWMAYNGTAFSIITNGGIYSGATTPTLTISGAVSSMNGYRYKCIISGTCPPAITSNIDTLFVNTAPPISSQPSNDSICIGNNAIFSVAATGTALTYQWQADTGTGFYNILNNSIYSGVTNDTMHISNPAASMSGHSYRCIISGTCSPADTSSVATLIVNTPHSITSQPINDTICNNDNAVFHISASGTGLTYQWQRNTGTGFTNISNNSTYSGATTDSLNITTADTSMNGYIYRCIISGTCSPPDTSSAASLIVAKTPAMLLTYNLGGTATLQITNYASFGTYQWTLNSSIIPGLNSLSNIATLTGCYGFVEYPASNASCYTSTTCINLPDCNNDTASFVATQAGYVLSFINTSTVTAAWQKMSSYWDFGDGSTDTATSPSHTYTGSNNDTVTLVTSWIDTATNSPQCTDTVKQVFLVGNVISGAIFTDTSAPNPSNPAFKVWLIVYDSSTQTLSAVDSTNDTGFAYIAYYNFFDEPAGDYLVKAMITNDTSTGIGPVPTYSYDSLHWSGADHIYYSGSGSSPNHNIIMQQDSVTSGPGFIAGNVNAGANKGTKETGTPVDSLLILLENINGRFLYHTYTDAAGNYSFSNIPVGTYIIYPEEMNYATTPWSSIYIRTSKPSFSNINFQEHTLSKTITPITTGIQNVNSENDIHIYPNPTTGILNVTSNSAANLIISDVVAHKVFESPINAGLTKLNLSSLKAGMYFISIKSADLNYSSKIIIQH